MSAFVGWNNELVLSSFSFEKAEAVLSLPCGSSIVKDSLLWHFNKNGCYSVKNGYKLSRQLLPRDVPSGSKGVKWWKSFVETSHSVEDGDFYLENLPQLDPYDMQPCS